MFKTRITLVLTLLVLVLASQASASQARVGHVAEDGSLVLYQKRFQPTFDDGTLVARVVASTKDGFHSVTRWADDNCRAERTDLHVGIDGSLFVTEASPLRLYDCEDDGCAERFGGACADNDALGVQCKCMKLSPDSTTLYTEGDWCKKSFSFNTSWFLGSWIYQVYIR